MSEKLQKILARAGLGSRRAMETAILEGKASVNGKSATQGIRVSPQDKIRFKGRIVHFPKIHMQRTRILMYHKPERQICSRKDPQGRDTVFNHLPTLRSGRWIAVGRLDFNTSGLLLFTNNGDLANKLMHPSYQVEREYAVRILGEVDNLMLKRMRKGVELEDGPARFNSITDAGGTGANHWYHVIICEGRQREVRRLWESQGVKVSRLIRVRYGNVALPPRLKVGSAKELNSEETKAFLSTISAISRKERSDSVQ